MLSRAAPRLGLMRPSAPRHGIFRNFVDTIYYFGPTHVKGINVPAGFIGALCFGCWMKEHKRGEDYRTNKIDNFDPWDIEKLRMGRPNNRLNAEGVDTYAQA